MSNYFIVYSDSYQSGDFAKAAQQLQAAVSDAMKKGWQPHGSVSIVSFTGATGMNIRLLQALVS